MAAPIVVRNVIKNIWPEISARSKFSTNASCLINGQLSYKSLQHAIVMRTGNSRCYNSGFPFIAHQLFSEKLASRNCHSLSSTKERYLCPGIHILFAKMENPLYPNSRQFKTETPDSNKDGHTVPSTDDIPSWLIKLANENGYLSWCRNTYILTIAAATIYTQFLVVPYAKETAVLLVIMGGINLLCGTYSYLHNIVKLVRRNSMSLFSLVPTFALGTFHVCLWFLAMFTYLGYIEEEGESEEVSDEIADSRKKDDKPSKGKKD